MYEHTQVELYDRALFYFTHQSKEINIVFEPTLDKEETNDYLTIIFCEDGTNIPNPHDSLFVEKLNEILLEFDQQRNLSYDVVAM